MNIWLPEMDVPPPVTHGLCEIGRFFVSPVAWLSGGGGGGLIQIANDNQIPTNGTDLARWYLPIGQGGNTFLLRELKTTGRPIYLAVNGLGQQALARVRAELAGADYTFIFDAREIPDPVYYQQLVWLSAQHEPFGVLINNMERMNIAAMLRPADILYPTPSDYDFTLLLKLVALFNAQGIRPISFEEVDQLAGVETSLSVVVPKPAGAVLDPADLCTVVTADRGLAPTLEKAIIGKTLRYDIAPGEPLTFGHFVET